MTDRPIAWTGIAFGLALAVLAAYQQLKLPPVLPVLLAEYGFDRVLAGGFMSIYALCGLVLSVRLGGMMQRRDFAPFLYLAFGLFAGAAMLMLVWPANGWLFLLARAVEGVAFAVLAIAGPSICTTSAGDRGLAIAAAIIATWIPLGNLIANALAATMGDSLGWRGLWWIGLAASAAMALWTARWRAAGRRARAAAPTEDTGTEDTGTEDTGTEDTGMVTPARGGRAAASPGHWRAMRLSAFLFALWGTQMFAYFTWLPAYLVETYGIAPREAARLYLVPILVLTVFNLVAAPILRAGVPVALLLAGAALVQATTWFLIPHSSEWLAGFLALALYAMAAGIIPTCLFAMPGTIFGVRGASTRAFGVLMTGRNLGVLVGPVLTGALIEGGGDWAVVSRLLGAFALAVAAGALFLHLLLGRLAPKLDRVL